MLKGVIFDFDGTLFDSMFIWEAAGADYLRSIGKEPEENLQAVLKSMSIQQSAEYIKKKYNIPLSIEEIMIGVSRTVEDFYFYNVEPKHEVIAFLDELQRRNIKMCIATATDRYQVNAALERFKMKHFFSEVFTCSEVGCGKDKPLIYRAAMEHLQTDRSNTIVVEDALHAIRTAKADGFSVAAVFDNSETQQTELRNMADCYLADFEHTESFWKYASAM